MNPKNFKLMVEFYHDLSWRVIYLQSLLRNKLKVCGKRGETLDIFSCSNPAGDNDYRMYVWGNTPAFDLELQYPARNFNWAAMAAESIANLNANNIERLSGVTFYTCEINQHHRELEIRQWLRDNQVEGYK